ncbi:MAG: ABC transporter permease [Vicinamibacterales bacterium]
MSAFYRDLIVGLRQLARRPVFSAAAIASLALGIGLNTTLFSVVNAVLLRHGPIARPDELVEIYTGLNKDYPQLTTSYPDYLDIVDQVDALSSVSAASYVRGILSSTDRPVLVAGEAVTANYFDLLGLPPALGRTFNADETRTAGSSPVIVLSQSLWRRQFGARPDVVGRTVRISGVAYTVIGVGPARFTGTIPGIPTEFWVPVTMVDQLQFSGVQATTDVDPGATRLERRGTRWLFVKGRLAPGRTVEEARAEIDALFARLRTQYPDTNDTATPNVAPASSIRFHPMLDGYVRAASAVLLVAVALVLIVACANVANLLLAQNAARRREFAVRVALGAGRARLIRQLVTEGLVLALIGGGVGVLIASWAGRLLSGLGSDILPIPIAFEFGLDGTVLAYALAVSVATSLLCSLAPAWSSSRPSLVPALKNAVDARRRFSLGDGLVVGQLALSLVLLVAGSLLTRSLFSARNTDIGFDPGPVASLSFNLQMNGYDTDRAVALRDRAVEALQALPGVVAVSTTTRLPLAPDINAEQVFVPGIHTKETGGAITDTAYVGADYFKAVGVPIVEGRAFTRADIATERRVAVVNETMARMYWPGRSAVGQRIYDDGLEGEPTEIVGVARDHKVRSVGEAPRPYLHLPTYKSRQIGLVVRTSTPAAAALPMLRQALWTLEPDILFTEDVTATEVAATTLAPTRIGALVLGAFGVLALVLAAVGLYGVIAHSVSRRTREVGIRMALGAPRGRVIRMIVWQGGRLAVIGIAIGAVGAALVAGVLDSLLYGVSGLDPIAYASAALLLLGVALAANLMPALTASRIDPARSLRAE